MHKLLKDAVRDTISQAWVVSDTMSKSHTSSSYRMEDIRCLIKYRVQIVLERPIREEYIGLHERQVYFSYEEESKRIAFHCKL